MTRRRRVRHVTVEHEPDCPAGPPPVTTVGEVYDLAGGLLRALAPVAGDGAAIDAYMRKWLDVTGVPAAGMVALAAIRTVFVDCLYPADSPAGAIGFDQPEDDTDDR